MEDLLEEDLKRQISDKGIELAQIINDVRRRAYKPGKVFQLSDNDKQVEVWLE